MVAIGVPLSRGELRTLRAWQLWVSGVAILLCLPTLATNLAVPSRRRFPARITTCFVSVALAYQATILAGGAVDFEGLVEGTAHLPLFCEAQGIVFQWCAVALVWLWTIITHVLYEVVVAERDFEDLARSEWKYHLWWVGCSTLQTVVPFAFNKAVPQVGTVYCWITPSDHLVWQLCSFHLEMLVALLYGLTCTVPIIRRLWSFQRALKRTSAGGPEEEEEEEKCERAAEAANGVVRDYLVRHSVLAVIFALVFGSLAAFEINELLCTYGYMTGLNMTVAFANVLAATGVGFHTFAVLGWTRQNRSHWSRCLRGLCTPHSDPEEPEQPCLGVSYHALGHEAARTAPDRKSVV